MGWMVSWIDILYRTEIRSRREGKQVEFPSKIVGQILPVEIPLFFLLRFFSKPRRINKSMNGHLERLEHVLVLHGLDFHI